MLTYLQETLLTLALVLFVMFESVFFVGMFLIALGVL